MAEVDSPMMALAKVPTGIAGFDAMTRGGLPKGRVSVIMGVAGAGKTVLALQALVNMINTEGGVGVFVSFEQHPDSVLSDVAAFDWNPAALADSGRLLILDGRPQPEAAHSGKFDISGLLAAVEAVAADGGVAGVAFDGIDGLLTILASLADQRTELLRLQESVSRLQSTTILSIKAGPQVDRRFEDVAVFMADCVVELDRSFQDDVSTRTIRVQKYRGSSHEQGAVPIIIAARGIEVELVDAHPEGVIVSLERLSTGIDRLDEMLGDGLYRGSTTLLSGAPGTAKTTIATQFLDAMCRRGERALGVCFDEAPDEMVRNVASVGIRLDQHLASGLLKMHGLVARSAGPDQFAYEIISQLQRHGARHLMIDPVSVFTNSSLSQNAIRRIIQFCKREGITVILTSLLERGVGELELSQSHVSTLCDNWVHFSYVVKSGERNRALTIIKSRGTNHSNQVGELLLSSEGIVVADVYTEDGEVLMGSFRWQKERSNERARELARERAAQQVRELARSAEEIASHIAALDAELAGKRTELEFLRQAADDSERLETERKAGVLKMRGRRDDGQQDGELSSSVQSANSV